MEGLASAYNEQGKYAEAEPLYIQTVEICEFPVSMHDCG